MSALQKYFAQKGQAYFSRELNQIRDIVLEEAGLKWIPVSEGLPEKRKDDPNFSIDVLISMKDYVIEGYYSYYREKWNSYTRIEIIDEILAYMPLPKPYKP